MVAARSAATTAMTTAAITTAAAVKAVWRQQHRQCAGLLETAHAGESIAEAAKIE